MAIHKRKRAPAQEEEEPSSDFSVVPQDDSDFSGSEDSVDISTALAGNKKRKTSTKQKPRAGASAIAGDGGDDDDVLQDIIRDSMAKRDVKEGTEVMKKTKGKNKLVKGEIGGGSFQSMGACQMFICRSIHAFRVLRFVRLVGLHPWLLRSLTLQGFRTPTPIQRQSIPVLLSNPPRDLVGMARTGSGKSLAFLVPLIQRLGGRHATSFGARALIMLPARELALQVMKVGKELARGWREGDGGHAGDKDNDDAEDGKRGQALRWGLIVGGESLDEQFEMISSNPDV